MKRWLQKIMLAIIAHDGLLVNPTFEAQTIKYKEATWYDGHCSIIAGLNTCKELNESEGASGRTAACWLGRQ
jgi:hypothetical protein